MWAGPRTTDDGTTQCHQDLYRLVGVASLADVNVSSRSLGLYVHFHLAALPAFVFISAVQGEPTAKRNTVWCQQLQSSSNGRADVMLSTSANLPTQLYPNCCREPVALNHDAQHCPGCAGVGGRPQVVVQGESTDRSKPRHLHHARKPRERLQQQY